ncbi:MAG: hypothetical protein PHS54_04930 [Clostridia bacterium]|nr:hypothetical protein [Clostridia bacterium]
MIKINESNWLNSYKRKDDFVGDLGDGFKLLSLKIKEGEKIDRKKYFIFNENNEMIISLEDYRSIQDSNLITYSFIKKNNLIYAHCKKFDTYCGWYRHFRIYSLEGKFLFDWNDYHKRDIHCCFQQIIKKYMMLNSQKNKEELNEIENL